jgi:DNA-binding NarL/FixJ family response regulator
MTTEINGTERVDAPRVVLADGDSATRAGIRVSLEQAGMKVCAEVATAEAVIETVANHEPDVVLISVDLQGGGLRAAASIAGDGTGPAVIMLAAVAKDDELIDAIRVGATGYVIKSIAPARLPAAVHAVLQGEPAIPRALVGVLMHQFRGRGAARHLSLPQRRGVELTSREWEVLDLMRNGLTTRQIAARLTISEITVRRHIGSVLKKLRVASRSEALKLLQSA